MPAIPNCLRAIRESRQWTLAKLAVEMQSSVNTVWMIETVGHFPSPKTIAKLTQALGVTAADIWPHLNHHDTSVQDLSEVSKNNHYGEHSSQADALNS